MENGTIRFVAGPGISPGVPRRQEIRGTLRFIGGLAGVMLAAFLLGWGITVPFLRGAQGNPAQAIRVSAVSHQPNQSARMAPRGMVQHISTPAPESEMRPARAIREDRKQQEKQDKRDRKSHKHATKGHKGEHDSGDED